jgi:hypothetical protein
MDFNSLARIDALSAVRIDTLKAAEDYVRKCADISGVRDSALMFGDIGSRLAAGELAAANEEGFVSDDQVAEAFNLMSDEFRVEHPARLTASDILQYRSVMAAIFPHLFSPKNMSGSRPIGAAIALYNLVYNGGITEGIRKAAELGRPPGSLKVTGGQIVARAGGPNRTEAQMKYQTASWMYFQQRSPQQIRSFLDRLAEIMAPTSGR